MKVHSHQNLKALIVDDEADICYLLSGILRQKNIQTSVAGSLKEAGKLIETQNDFTMIFLDNNLPDGQGVAMVGRFKEKNPAARLVMITAYDTSKDQETAYKNGVDYFIGKPFSKDIIFKTVDLISA